MKQIQIQSLKMLSRNYKLKIENDTFEGFGNCQISKLEIFVKNRKVKNASQGKQKIYQLSKN